MFSNFLSIHQLPLAEALYQLTEGNFTFVATDQVSVEQLRFGYPDLDHQYPFVLRTYGGEQEKNSALKLALEADIVIHGSAPWFYLEERLEKKKLTFLYSERLYKSGYERWKWPVRMIRFYKKYGRHKNLHLLCASAHTAADFAKTYTFLKKTYKWGYFPEVKRYEDFTKVQDEKTPNSILWAGRFIDWKHPDDVIRVAKRLKGEGFDFQIRMLGNGVLWEEMNQLIKDLGLEECVQLVGAVPSDQVRSYMESASIYLFTSDRNEGWGAVLNESMNSGCAVVACDAVGAVPFLMKDGENGLCYHSGNQNELYEKVKFLLDNRQERERMAANAYHTIIDEWNADVAAEKFLKLADAILNGEKCPELFADGVCGIS
jgi:glycosyltransferase involved in cell wall biosynthesis